MRLAGLVIIVAGLMTGSASGHHGTAVSYDSTKEVTDDKGALVNWSVEMSSPGVLLRAGWTRKTFVAGDAISIVVHPSRAGTPVGVCLNPCTVSVNGTALSVREP